MFPVLSIPNCIWIGSAIFAQLMAEPHTFQLHQNAINAQLKKIIAAINEFF